MQRRRLTFIHARARIYLVGEVIRPHPPVAIELAVMEPENGLAGGDVHVACVTETVSSIRDVRDSCARACVSFLPNSIAFLSWSSTQQMHPLAVDQDVHIPPGSPQIEKCPLLWIAILPA